jgi:lipopolysaccharide transport system ATP-binding protein
LRAKAVDLAHGREIVQGDEVEEFWALKDVSIEVQKGHVSGSLAGMARARARF